jgi:hypothetical protein
MKKVGILPPDHAWCVPKHLSAVGLGEAYSFDTYIEGDSLFVISKQAFMEFWAYNDPDPVNP